MNHKGSILVVDDDPMNLTLLTDILELEGYQVVPAVNGKDALDKALSQPLDLVLSDVMMPEMHGFDLTRELRHDEKTRLIPVVLVTSMTETEDRIMGIEAGCDDFISKPYDKNEVLARVETLLILNYYRSQLDEKEKFESLVKNMREGAVVFDSKLNIKLANKQASELLQLDATKGDDWGLSESISQKFSIEYQGQLIHDIKIKNLTFDLQRQETPESRPLVVEIQSNIIRTNESRLSSIIWIIRDVTELRRREFVKMSFLDLISHKLRTPLSVLEGNISLLEDETAGSLNEQQMKMIQTCQKRTHEFHEMIEELLVFNELNNMQLDRPEEPLDIKEHLSRFIPAYLKEKSEIVEWQLMSEINQVDLMMHHKYFNMIVSQILDNAIKFNDSPTINIIISLKKINGTLRMIITDNGRGVSPEDKEKIFDKFFQVEKWDTGQMKGLGLGLAIVNHLVQRHNGTIEFDSVMGQGTSFIIDFRSAYGETDDC